MNKYILSGVIILMTPFIYITESMAAGSGDHEHHHPGHMAGMDGMSGMHHRHQHMSWVKAPEKYATRRNPDWNDQASAKRGKVLYEQQCASCHGLDGQGNGPVAASLAHKPADLTHHFLMGPGKGDAYLYWRITEGGTVEPFKSQQSLMPAFSFLTEKERWDILTYVHQEFHRGFKTPE